MELCNDSYLDYVIEMFEQDNQTLIRTYKQSKQMLTIENLNSFSRYTFRVYAINQLGSSPKSDILTVQTLETGLNRNIHSLLLFFVLLL